MKTIEIIGYKRANLGKSESRNLRNDGNVPCVVYGGKEQIHFYSPMILFRELIYSPGANFIDLNIEGKKIGAILQEVQFHPVSDIILHADFLELIDDKKIKMEIPVSFTGSSPGVKQGGKILPRLRKLMVQSLPKHMPEFIEIDVSGLELGKSIKVGDLEEEEYDILNSPLVSIVSVNIPRVTLEEVEEEVEDEEGEEGAEGVEGKEGTEKGKEGTEGAEGAEGTDQKQDDSKTDEKKEGGKGKKK